MEDRLGRGKYVQFLINIIRNSEQYRRDDDSKAYVIAVDAPWGTGKTFLMDMLASALGGESGNVKVVKYNAWQHDFTQHPLESLFYEVYKSGFLNVPEDKVDVVFNGIKMVMGGLYKDAVAYGIPVLKNTANAIKDVANGVQNGDFKDEKQYKAICHQFMEEQEILNASREILTKNCRVDCDRLVIVIDELDRCKPLFAINLLETVKHLFNISKLVFVFALDVQQLSSSIRAVYGNDFDAPGYLCRFFDYVTKVPQPDLRSFVGYELSKIGNLPNAQVPDLHLNEEKIIRNIPFRDAMVECIFRLHLEFDLSLRDIDTIIVNYRMLVDTLLYDYKNIWAHYIYLYFLTLKYKKPIEYGEIFARHGHHSKLLTNSKHLCIYFPVQEALNMIYGDGVIGAREWYIECNSRSLKRNSPVQIYGCCGENLTYHRADQICSCSMKVNDEVTLGAVLFKSDLTKWDEIENLTYAQYLHQQLENYNFVQLN